MRAEREVREEETFECRRVDSGRLRFQTWGEQKLYFGCQASGRSFPPQPQ